VATFAADGDGLATVEDNQHLAQILPNLIDFQVFDYPDFNHLDFLVSEVTGEVVYQPVLRVIVDFINQ